MTQPYFFILGSTPDLSVLELERFFSKENVSVVTEGVCQVELETQQSAKELLSQLGGVVKICKPVKTISEQASETELEQEIAEVLSASAQTAKIIFAVAEFGRNHLPALTIEKIKDNLQAKDHKVRFIDGPRYGLSAAILLHRKVQEVVVIKTEDAHYLAITEAVQDIDFWTVKDREKPYANRKKGMLPPKLARIMVNLAVGSTPVEKATLYDPFCGTGTVLIEAISRGLNVIGSDTDSEAVNGSRENLSWLREKTNFSAEFQIYQGDATTVMLSKKVQYLVTEPFLGKPKPQPDHIPNIFKGLEKMYLGAFKHWRSLLVPGATVVIIFPRALAATTGIKQDVTLDALIDKLKTLGYTPLLDPVLYHRPQAMIGREVRVFTFQPAL